MEEKKILVTQPVLPSLENFIPLLEDIWESKWITNNGKFHKILEKELASYLNVPYISLFSNGTMALITSLQELKISGEVITTPYSFVATTHALWWNNIKPVFVDIEKKTCNIDPEKIEAAITPKTAAILPVHVYGTPCDVEKIERISNTYGLKVIYDAAHSFGVQRNGVSILNYGDLSILSFHATKVYNTIEGGAIICHDKKTKERIDNLKNFGFINETKVVAPGINAKMNELQAAYGLLQLKTIDENIIARKKVANTYKQHLSCISDIRLLEDIGEVKGNYGYYPIFIDRNRKGFTRDNLYEKLKENNIYSRRYFYPLITDFPTYRGLPSARKENIPIAEKIAQEVLCLPIYPTLTKEEQLKIINLIHAEFN